MLDNNNNNHNNNNQELIIEGFNFSKLYEQQQLLKQAATKYISNNTDQLLNEILNCIDRNKGREFKNRLHNIKLVAAVANIEYYIPFQDYKCWDDDDSFTKKLEKRNFYSVEDEYKNDWNDLLNLLDDMESQSHRWNGSLAIQC